MDIQALLSQLIPFLMELVSGFVSMASSMASENSGTLKAGAAASIIAGAALSGGGNPNLDLAKRGISAVGAPKAAVSAVRGAPSVPVGAARAPLLRAAETSYFARGLGTANAFATDSKSGKGKTVVARFMQGN